MRNHDLRDSTLESPVGELKVLQRQSIVLRLDIVGEDIAVVHFEIASKPSLVRTESRRGYLAEKATRQMGVSKWLEL